MVAKRPLVATRVTAMIAQGATHAEIAGILHCSTKTVQRIARDIQADIRDADAQLAKLRQALSTRVSIEDRADKYADLAMKARNEAVSLGALQRIDDLDGIETRKDMRRYQGEPDRQHQPMFLLPAGAQVSVTVNQQATIYSKDVPGNGAQDAKSTGINTGSVA